jgi:adenine-specific DNA-methyltransferase
VQIGDENVHRVRALMDEVFATGEVTLPSGEPALAGGFMEWEVPREAPADWPEAARAALAAFWEARIARQKEIDASIAAKAEFEYLYDKPYVDNSRVRVAGPFTVESLSPHRTPPSTGTTS